eukprot:Clim_evm44s128 gene=Clim_evmTU44s128
MTEVKECRATAPGKVILHGEHAVVHGCLAVAGAIDLRTKVTVKRHGEPFGITLTIVDAVESIKFNFDYEGVTGLQSQFNTAEQPAEEYNLKLVEELDSRLRSLVVRAEDLKGNPLADPAEAHMVAAKSFLYALLHVSGSDPVLKVDVEILSDLPVGAGLGSSASFSVALVAALLCAGSQIPESPSQPPVAEDLALVNAWAFQLEKIIHGNPSGIDNTVVTYGGLRTFQNMPDGSRESHPVDTDINVPIGIYNTRIPRSTKKLVAGVGEIKKQKPEEFTKDMEAFSNIVQRFMAIANGKHNDQQRAEFMKKWKELIIENQVLLEGWNLSLPEIREFVSEWQEKLDLVVKITGAGGGGCLLVAGDESELQKMGSAIKDDTFMVTSVGCDGVQWGSLSSYVSDGNM